MPRKARARSSQLDTTHDNASYEAIRKRAKREGWAEPGDIDDMPGSSIKCE